MYALLRPLLFRLDPERAHRWAFAGARLIQALHPGLIRPFFRHRTDGLAQTIWGLQFPAPLGLAAGADKNATLVRFWQELGFGSVEVGSVTANASDGNPKPRAFRLPADRAVINRMGLNNEGADRVAQRIAKARARYRVPVGINIAKTHDPAILGDAAIRDFAKSFVTLAPHADYITLNISCPNTREGKTFESEDALTELMTAIGEATSSLPKKPPVLLKVSPPPAGTHTATLTSVLTVAERFNVAGFVATNTASDRTGLSSDADAVKRIGAGGLSGPPLFARSLQTVATLYRETKGQRPIIGVGGIETADDAYRMHCAGASLLQAYTGFIYRGPGLAKRIHQGLRKRLLANGFKTLEEAIGSANHAAAA